MSIFQHSGIFLSLKKGHMVYFRHQMQGRKGNSTYDLQIGRPDTFPRSDEHLLRFALNSADAKI